MSFGDKEEPIAIIGAACRLSGDVSALGDLWDMISKVKTGHCKVPADRWDGDVMFHPDPDRKGGLAVKHGYFLQQDISHFDAPFFSTTAKEAAAMDPMKRLLLEVSYECIENAGIPVEKLYNSQTGCYVGCMNNDYEMLSLHDIYDIGHTAASATSEAMTANRVSWFYGLKGPSLTLDTACSSSLYALHLACQSLKLKETDMSLVAGVNLLINPNTMHQLSAMHMLSPEGISHTFDDRANGYGRGEGIGCLAVKRLSDAIRDGDTIRAVIRHTGANADGKTPSITQPSSEAQAELIKRTYEMAGLPLSSTQYFECHGTGTPVGDPIELRAIASTLGAARTKEGLGPLYIGSIKPNVGHTEGCSGLAGVFKALVCLEKGKLVPTYGVEQVNPKLTFKEWNLALPETTINWPSRGQRRVSVNSFGFGGANAHVILDDAYHYLKARSLPGNHATAIVDDDYSNSDSGLSSGSSTPLGPDDLDDTTKRLFVFSSADKAGIERIESVYGDKLGGLSLSKVEPTYFTNLAYTLASRRTHQDFRSFVVASSFPELAQALISKRLPKLKRSQRQGNNLTFVFTGQGAQWPAMGRELLSNRVFESSVRASQSYLEALGCKWNAIEELQKVQDSRISRPEFSQTLCTVLQVALVDLLRHWNVIPKATVGHSSGEIGAAYAASYISHADAIKIAYVRGISSENVPRKGAMMAAGVSREEAQQYLSELPHEAAVVACHNSPSSVTLSGDVDAIDALEKRISEDGKFARKLKVSTAYHSPHMRDVAQGYLEKMGHIQPLSGNGVTIMYSSLTGKLASPTELDAKYWVSNMCAPVEFSTAVAGLLSATTQAPGGKRKTPIKWSGFVEVGPHSALQGPVQQSIAASKSNTAKEAPYYSLILRGRDANTTALTAAANIWSLGVDVDLLRVNGIDRHSTLVVPKVLTDLPPYPWNHSRKFWHEAYISRSNRFPKAPRTDLLGVPEDLQNPMEPRWRNHLRISENPWIEDHKITGTVLFPAAGMLVMALEGAKQMADASKTIQGFRYRNVNFERGLVVTTGDESAVETRLSLLPDESVPGQFKFTVYSTSTGTSWTKHCSGQLQLEYDNGQSEVESGTDAAWSEQTQFLKKITAAEATEDVEVGGFYDHLETIGMQYGPLFRNVISLTAVPSENASHGTVILPDTLSSMPANFEYPHVMHPATMDSIFHLVLAAFNGGKPITEASVPYHIEEMYVAADQPHGANSRFKGYGRLVSSSMGGHETVGDLVVSDENWSAPKLIVTNFALRRVATGEEGAGVAGNDEGEKKCARVEWLEDVDFVKTDEELSRLAAADVTGGVISWLDRISHKKVVGKLLLVLSEQSERASEVIKALKERVGRRPGFEKITAVITEPSAQDALVEAFAGLEVDIQAWNPSSEDEFPGANGGYDVVLAVGAGEQPAVVNKIHTALSTDGQLLVVSTAQVDAIKNSLGGLGFEKVLASESGVLVASKPASKAAEDRPSEVYLLLPTHPSAELAQLSLTFIERLASLGVTTHTTTLVPKDAQDLASKHIISLLEIDSPLIYSWNADEFAAFKALMQAKHLLWVTKGSLLESWSAGVEFAPAQGLLRVMRNEYTLATLPHFDLSAAFDLTKPSNAELIAQVWASSLSEDAEMEYAELNGAIHIPRAVDEAGFDTELQRYSGQAKPVLTPIRGNKHLRLGSAANVWVEDNEASLPLANDEVEIDVDFIGISDGVAREATGVIAKRGRDAKTFSVGQRVVTFGTDALKTRLRQKLTHVAAAPSGLNPAEVAALPNVFIAAQYALTVVGGVTSGSRVLIHDAGSPLGVAAVQVSKSVGAEVFALVASKDAKEALVRRYGLSAERIFDSNLINFITAIRQATNGHGVDAVLVGTPGPAVQPSLAALSDFGTVLDLSAATNTNTPQINLPASKKNASLLRIDMSHIQAARPQTVVNLFQATFNGSLTPVAPVINVFPVSQLSAALDAKHDKIVVSFGSNDRVLTPSPPVAPLTLDANATYVLAGGLGALGLNIAKMMVGFGAKHLVFLSRSGGSKNQKDLEEFKNQGVLAEAFKCDVNDAVSVQTVFDGLRKQQKVVKGLIQCAMVLEDSIFDNMTFDKWFGAFQPKTRGSRNLLSQLSSDVSPFFVLLSSITGVIGNTAQANYASGNTFEDALAHHARRYLGIRATSIDVGLVTDSSHFTSAGEFGDLDGYLGRYSHGWVGLRCTVEELKVAIAAVMRGNTPTADDVPAQFVLGLGDQLVREPGTTGFVRDLKFELRLASNSGGANDAEGANRGPSVVERLSKATSQAEAAAAVEDSLKAQIGAAIGIEASEVDVQKPLPEFGVDSLKAVEMRNRVLKEMKSDISVFELLSASPLAELAVKIASRSSLVKAEAGKAE
ncbi:hypothetical protein GGS23DRAFT_201723 [Durotheca rogersii]|uniref:uncharacterized protein n=1 Tax=Durotheca rogersii TaxID=419775 RepID=UPI00221F5787|nr:uncharacterized protein GGS23DRAFT_201723 [Durotheca rogersii]KAI5867872.1 hypothetical protein GGS23DRAFT_201723 [Durotheca rogersii]